jgi:type IX secretion system PorP/SprF family membrane protein
MPGGPKNMVMNLAIPSTDNHKSVGLFYLQENAGFSKLTNAYMSYAYSFQVADEGAFSLGVSLGVLSQNFDASKAVYLSQNDPVVHSLMFSPTATRADLRASAFFTLNGFSAGISSSRLPTPRFDYTYYNYTAKYSLQNLSSLFVSYDWQVNSSAKIKPSLLINAYDFNYFRYQGNLSYIYKEKFWLGLSASDASHLGVNLGFNPHNSTKVGYQVNFQTGNTAAILGPVHEFYLGIGLGALRAKPLGEVENVGNEIVSNPSTTENGNIKRRYKNVTITSLVEFQMEGLDLDTSGITLATIDKEKKVPGIYLVAGLHSDENKANQQIKDLYMRGMCAYKFYDPVNKSYYIYIKQFVTMTEASRFIMNNDTGLPQAWIREVK